jgi:NitT/TauT family transport system permease protein
LVLAPLFLVWFGFGPFGKIALVSTIVVFITFFSVYSGLKEVSSELVEAVRCLGAGEKDLWWHVKLPAIVGRVIASMRVSVGLSIGAAIVGEFVGSAHGVGYLVAYGSNLFRSADVYAGLLAVVLFVAIVDYGLRRLEGSLNRWSVA